MSVGLILVTHLSSCAKSGRIEHGMTGVKYAIAVWRQMTGRVVPEKARLFKCTRERVLFGACFGCQISARSGAFSPFFRKGYVVF